MRSRSKVHITCPVCEYNLRGTAAHGYRCIKCHTHYSTNFVRRLRREQFKEAVHTHFASPSAKMQEVKRVETVEESRILIDDKDHAFVETIKEAAHTKTPVHSSASPSSRLEEVVRTDGSEYLEIAPVQFTSNNPSHMFQKQRRFTLQEYAVEHAPGTRKAQSAKQKKSTAARKKTKSAKPTKRGKKQK